MQNSYKSTNSTGSTFGSMEKHLLLFILLGWSQLIFAQELTQTIRGTILDKDSQLPLIGATITLVALNKGTVTEVDGSFRVEKIPLGRQELIVSYLGYEEKVIPNINVNDHYYFLQDK